MKYTKGDKVAKLSKLNEKLEVEAEINREEYQKKTTEGGLMSWYTTIEVVDEDKPKVKVKYYSLSDNTVVKEDDITIYNNGLAKLQENNDKLKEEIKSIKKSLGRIGNTKEDDDEDYE